MAKKSAIEKNLRRVKLVKRHTEKRRRLKAIISDRSLPIEDRFEAQLKFSEMPRNSGRRESADRAIRSGEPLARKSPQA